DAALTIKQAAGGTLNLTGSFFDIKQQVLTVNNEGSVDISKPLNSSFAAGGSLIKQGNGTLTLSNTSNNYTGTNNVSLNASGTQIAAGTLAIAADGSLGLAPAGAYNNVQFTGNGTLRSNGNISLSSTRNISVASGVTATLDSNGNTFTVNGVINGASGAVSVSGAGAVVLNGNNTYGGITTVNAGADLRINGTNSGTGAVNIAATGKLGGEGSVGGQVNISGTLAPGNSIESIGTGAVNFLAGSTYAYELNSASLNGDLTFSSGTLDIANVTTLTLTQLASGTLALGSKLTLISYLSDGGASGWNDGLFTYNASSLTDDSTFILGANIWLFNYNDTSGGSNFSGNQTGANRFVTMTVVPEPNAAMLIGGLGMLALLRRRRD
ncbi:MAG: autotransporter-associated beta strand repeat-containing protein, partial [Gloeobacteraceae cyanobacterium ES-bin-144]|nr:autotransporter-associated beta strand repeat-containing protein [Verrucomicrobiales bacterium]